MIALPGDTQQTPAHRGRIAYRKRITDPPEYRYFSSHAAAYKARHQFHRAGYIAVAQYWHTREQAWIG